MRALALTLVVLAFGATRASAEPQSAACPGDAALGTVTFPRGGAEHTVSLADCRDRVVGRAKAWRWPSQLRSHAGRVATIRFVHRPHARFGTQTITVDGRAVHRVREDYRAMPAGAPGPLGLLAWSPDSRWLIFYVDPMGSASIAADGLELQALRITDGRVVPVAPMLLSPDYLTWCGSTLVMAAGGDRLATHNKRLVAARAPAWKPRPLWRDPSRAFGSVACAPDGRSVAVLAQRAQAADYNFFHTTWQLWRVGLNGSRRLLDVPPKGSADESPRFSRDGRSLLFVRERRGNGRLMLLRAGRLTGPIAKLGYSLGYYGHHDWWAGASWSAGA